eukprot:m.58520 g.58520  ORF g.58520 m.58520 type:complete len:688 (+) comp34819_c0_seq5:1767-3830(+)
MDPLSHSRKDSATRESTWRPVFALSIVLLAVCASLFVIILDINRFFGTEASECGTYSDSGSCQSVEAIAYASQQQQHRASTVDELSIENGTTNGSDSRRQPGIIFKNRNRSEVAWIYTSIIFSVSIIMNWSLLSYRINERHKPCRTVLKGGGDAHSDNYRRICGTIFVCTALAVLYEMIVLGKLVRCERSGAEIANTLLGTINFIVQGMYLVYEVLHRTHNKVREGPILLSILRAQAIINLALWLNALFVTACRVEPDNQIYFGKDVWIIFRPIFRASIVALRILSSLMFFMISFPHKHDAAAATATATAASNGRSPALNQSLKDEVSAVWSGHMGEVEAKQLEVRNMEVANALAKGSTRIIRSISQGVVPFGKRKDHHYGVVLRALEADNGNRIKVEPITNKHIASDALTQAMSFPGLIIVLAPPVVLGWALRLRGHASEPARYVPELVMNFVIIVCCVVIFIPKYALPWSKGTRKSSERLRDFFSDPELLATSIFGVGASLYYLVPFVLYCKYQDHFMNAWPQLNSFFGFLSVVLQLLVIILFHMRDMFSLQKPDHLTSLIVFGIMVTSSVSLFIMQIEREEFGVDEHTFVHDVHLGWVEPLLGVLVPLAIDFRLHAFLLTYSTYADYAGRHAESFANQDEDDASSVVAGDRNSDPYRSIAADSNNAGDPYNSTVPERRIIETPV